MTHLLTSEYELYETLQYLDTTSAEGNDFAFRGRAYTTPVVPSTVKAKTPMQKVRSSEHVQQRGCTSRDFVPLRSFKIDPKTGVLHKEVSPTRELSKSKNSFISHASNLSIASNTRPLLSDHSSTRYQSSTSVEERACCNIFVIGQMGVGKSSVINQFMSSEDRNPFVQDDVLEESFGKTVSVLLGEEETKMTFIEVQNYMDKPELSSVDGYIIVYSVDNASSFQQAKAALEFVRRTNNVEQRPVILVANKIDLERKRVVTSSDGRKAAESCGSKFVETSVVVGHMIDHLLVGIVTQIRARRLRPGKKVAASNNCRRNKPPPNKRGCFNLTTLGNTLVCKLTNRHLKSCEVLFAPSK